MHIGISQPAEADTRRENLRITTARVGAALIFLSFFLPQYELWFFGYFEASPWGALWFNLQAPGAIALARIPVLLLMAFPAIVSVLLFLGSFGRLRGKPMFRTTCTTIILLVSMFLTLESMQKLGGNLYSEGGAPAYWPPVVYLSALLLCGSGFLATRYFKIGSEGIAVASRATLSILITAIALATVLTPSDRSLSAVNLTEGALCAILGGLLAAIGESFYFCGRLLSRRRQSELA